MSSRAMFPRVLLMLLSVAMMVGLNTSPASAAQGIEGSGQLRHYRTGMGVGFEGRDAGGTAHLYTFANTMYITWKSSVGAYEIKEKGSGLCLDAWYDRDDAYGWNCNGARSQRWKAVYVGDRKDDMFYQRTESMYNLVNLETGECLDADFRAWSYTFPCNGGDWQLWFRGPVWD
jgi:hypothetical protein